jgi:glucose-6-phosphate-specific signal transduction histidine kinase
MTAPLPGNEPDSPGPSSPAGTAFLDAHTWPVCLRQLAQLHETDRHNAARALHNQIGQAVSAIKMSAHLTLDEADAAQRRDDLLEIIRIADDTVAQLRDLHALLHPPQLESLGLEAALRGEAERFSANSPVTLDIAALPQRPDPEIELTGFRIVQCLLRQTTAADSRARLFLQLRDDGESLRLRLECDRPLDRLLPDTQNTALNGNVSLLRAWAMAVHGDLNVDTLPDVGIRFELRLPYALPEMAVSTHASAY